jgi:hypothetical protein
VKRRRLAPICSRKTRFLQEIIDHVTLMLVEPAGERHQDELQWMDSDVVKRICRNYNGCKRCAMTEKVSTIDVRQRIGDMLNRVSLRHDEFIIERKGKALAALVPVERLEQMRRFARTQAIDFLERQKGSDLTDVQAADLALEAQHSARRVGRRSKRKAK